MRNLFISFLGTGNYQSCTYNYENISVTTKYIQSALIQMLYKDFSEEDCIKIFMTDAAKKLHWDSPDGLKTELCNLGLSEILREVIVPEGKTEAELWEIFKIMYNEIEPKDNIVFDATHGFRSLPIFGMTILNYSHYLKNISVEGIYYGAYEAKNDENEAPVFNLSASFNLMQWASAADLFTNYGVAKKFTALAKKQKKEDSDIKKLSEAILKMTNNMKYARGKQITKGEMFNRCIEQIDLYRNTEDAKRNPALAPILDTVTDKIKGFQTTSDALNFMPAVQWYIDHDMPAEAISMMKEGIITYLIEKQGYDYKDQGLRLTLGQRLSYTSKKEFKYNDKNSFYKESIESIMNTELANNLQPIVERFNSLRNDIDHCGYAEQARNPENINKEIVTSFNDISEVFIKSGEIEYH